MQCRKSPGGNPVSLHHGAGRLGALLVMASYLSVVACSSGPPHELEMMPAPAAYEDADAPFGEEVPPGVEGSLPQLAVLYATNRAPQEGESADEPYYSGERGYLVRLGSAQMGLGNPDISWQEARSISLLKNRPDSFPVAVKGVDEFGILPESVSVFTPEQELQQADQEAGRAFLQAVETQLARSQLKDIFIYVHGYKVNFENPLMVASEMWHFLGYEGAFIAFSWPSTPDRLAYFKDVETARVSAWGLRKLVDFLSRESSARRIHIVGYSAGTRVVLTTLYEIALLHGGAAAGDIQGDTRLGNVILVGSDVDTGMFASYVLDGLLKVQERLTLYTSPSDAALHISEKVFSHRRLGEVLPGTLDDRMREYMASTDRMSMIDVAEAENFDEGNGHGYFRRSPWVSSDILMTLRYGLEPAERGLEQREGSPIWRFPPDYLSRFDSALERQRRKALSQPAL